MNQAAQTLAIIGAAGLLALGLWVLRRARGLRAGDEAPSLRLAGVGEVSPVSLQIMGLCCVGVAYHLIVHAFHVPLLRAPWPVAMGVAFAATLLSLLTDAIENSTGSGGSDAG